jgi:hypothetical protein
MKLSARHVGGVALAFLAVLTTAIIINKRYAAARNIQLPAARFIPAEAENDTGGKVLGNVQNAVEDFKELYKFIHIYRERQGQYPAASDLIRDMHEIPDAYGYRNFREADSVFLNPDTRFSDLGQGLKGSREPSPYIFLNKRPDGTPIGGAKQPGRKDLLAYTNIYIYHNNRYPKNKPSTSNPVGFYVMLWDDGTITQVPYDKIILGAQR